MSQEWLKIEKATPNKPEVRKIAVLLGITRYEVFGRLFDVWSYFDTNCDDPESGIVAFTDRATVDDVAGFPGFALAMIQVGWLTETRNGLLALPNFDRHNGETAKQRSLAAQRQAKKRSRNEPHRNPPSRDERDKDVTEALPEKNREEYPPKAPQGGAKKRFRRRGQKTWKEQLDEATSQMEAP